VATGPDSGVFVLDVDGEPGADVLLAYDEQGQKLPNTLLVSTGRGIHVYFRWPGGHSIRNSAGKLSKNLDIRGENGYVVIPPSIHPNGEPYVYGDPNEPVSEAPEWLLEMIKQPSQPVPMPPGTVAPKGIVAALMGPNSTFGEPHTPERVREIAAMHSARYPAGHTPGTLAPAVPCPDSLPVGEKFKPTYDESRRYFESRLGVSLPARDEVQVRCIWHDDQRPSMSINLKAGTWYCHSCLVGGGLLDFERKLKGKADAECWMEINATIGRDGPDPNKSYCGQTCTTYAYHDAGGNVVFEAVRYNPKKFLQRRPDGKGGWIWNMDSVTRVPFNLPTLTRANVVLIAEGEKDALNLQKAATEFPDKNGELSYAATCNIGGAGKWRDEYSPYLAGKEVYVFQDNDHPGRKHAQQVCLSVEKFAQNVYLVELPGLAEHGDVSDYLEAHSPSELFELILAVSVWTPPDATIQPRTALEEAVWPSEDMDTFLAETEADLAWLVPEVLAPGRLTEIFAPRGLGKSLLAHYWAVETARRGLRVLILDRDNTRITLQTRLRSFGAEDLKTLRVVSREKCPPLTKPDAWRAFPYADYDLVIVDSLDAMAEGVGEQDSSKPARAMAPLLDICHRENGPAVLLLGNTIKSAAHSRGSGVVEDRADIVFELRDGTNFKPTGSKPWIEELPPQGADEWRARNARRKGRTIYRIALVATKFRDGEEPAPRMLEISMEDLPWTVADVTASIDAIGEAERLRAKEEKKTKIVKGIAMLLDEIDTRSATGQPAILKTVAEEFLMKAGYTRKDARFIIASDHFVAVSVPGKGHPMELHKRYESSSLGGNARVSRTQ